jgi:methylenetetrahydrofolate dehydrogenase (NADP+)/methenyltetrahydrofolate cyclohydrolase
MNARIIDGKALATRWRVEIGQAGQRLRAAHGIVPGLAVVMAGDDPASSLYVSSKGKAAREAGFHVFDIRLPASVSEHTLLGQIAELNADAAIHGILVQLPLPDPIDARAVIHAIDPLKDVDGLHPENAGRLMTGEYTSTHGLVPCTPLGCIKLIESTAKGSLSGAQALVIGRSNLVGKPMAHLLLQADCTVTLAHSKTRDLASLAAEADILVAAAGHAGLVRGTWIKQGAMVIDVGTNRGAREGETKLVGDVAYDEAVVVAGAITPVPGGVGPMTIAALMRNTLMAASLQAGLPAPEI